jgi:hypothetical protein
MPVRRNLALLALAAALAPSLSCRRTSRDEPTRADLLAKGGIYPVVVPLGWKAVNPEAKDEEIPRRGEPPFHRIIAQGAMMAKESEAANREFMIFTALHEQPPITEAMLDGYADDIVKQFVKNGVPCRVSEKKIFERAKRPAAKVVIERDSTDGRVAVDYLFEDAKHELWQLSYMIRRDDLGRWQPMLAEVESPPAE